MLPRKVVSGGGHLLHDCMAWNQMSFAEAEIP